MKHLKHTTTSPKYNPHLSTSRMRMTQYQAKKQARFPKRTKPTYSLFPQPRPLRPHTYRSTSAFSEELDIFNQAPRGVPIKDIERKRARMALSLSASTKPMLRRIQRLLNGDCSRMKPASKHSENVHARQDTDSDTSPSTLASTPDDDRSEAPSQNTSSTNTNASSRISLLAHNEHLARLHSFRLRTEHLHKEYAEIQNGIDKGRFAPETSVVRDTLRVLDREFESLEAEWKELKEADRYVD